MINLTRSPYITLKNPNPITTPLTLEWEKIKRDYYAQCIVEGRYTPDGVWTGQGVNSHKVNNNTESWRSHQPSQVFYGGVFQTMCLFLRHELTDIAEREALNWVGSESFRLWPDRILAMPLLRDFINKHSNIIGSIIFITGHPQSVINPHFGLNNKYLRFHLCLEEVPGAVFNIEGWEHSWKNGGLFGFDDANVLHGTLQYGTKPRSLLIFDLLKTAIKPWCTNWTERSNKPDKRFWPDLMNDYQNNKKLGL